MSSTLIRPRRSRDVPMRIAVPVVLVLLGGCGTQAPSSPAATASAHEPSAAQPSTTEPPASATADPTSTPIPVDEWPLAEIEPVPNAGFGGAFAKGIAVGGPGLVAVGSVSPCCADVAYDDEPWSAVVWTSRDGRRWKLLPDLASFGRAGLVDVAADDRGTLVALGYEILPPDPARPDELLQREMRLWRSTNGTDWFSIPAPDGDGWSIAWGADGWVIGGETGERGGHAMAWTSPDLETWTAEDFGAGWLTEVAASDDGAIVATGLFDATGSIPVTQALTRSPDGRWSRAELDGSVQDLVWHPDLGFVAVGYGDEDGIPHAASWSSADGKGWRSSHLTGSELAAIDAVTVAGDLVFGVGSASEEAGATEALWSSDGGASWTGIGRLQMPSGTGPLSAPAIAFRDAQYVVIGSRFVDAGGRTFAWHGP